MVNKVSCKHKNTSFVSCGVYEKTDSALINYIYLV